jgi:hypothetical protein
MGYGDYPELPNISGDSKDPFYPWDNPELKRNFNEPVSDKLRSAWSQQCFAAARRI